MEVSGKAKVCIHLPLPPFPLVSIPRTASITSHIPLTRPTKHPNRPLLFSVWRLTLCRRRAATAVLLSPPILPLTPRASRLTVRCMYLIKRLESLSSRGRPRPVRMSPSPLLTAAVVGIKMSLWVSMSSMICHMLAVHDAIVGPLRSYRFLQLSSVPCLRSMAQTCMIFTTCMGCI